MQANFFVGRLEAQRVSTIASGTLRYFLESSPVALVAARQLMDIMISRL